MFLNYLENRLKSTVVPTVTKNAKTAKEAVKKHLNQTTTVRQKLEYQVLYNSSVNFYSLCLLIIDNWNSFTCAILFLKINAK